MRPTRKKSSFVLAVSHKMTKFVQFYRFCYIYLSLSLSSVSPFPFHFCMRWMFFFCLGCCCCYYCLSFRYSVDIQILFIWIIIILSSQRCHNQTLFHMACTVCFARTTKSDIISNQQTVPPHICIYRRTLLRNCVFFFWFTKQIKCDTFTLHQTKKKEENTTEFKRNQIHTHIQCYQTDETSNEKIKNDENQDE